MPSYILMLRSDALNGHLFSSKEQAVQEASMQARWDMTGEFYVVELLWETWGIEYCAKTFSHQRTEWETPRRLSGFIVVSAIYGRPTVDSEAEALEFTNHCFLNRVGRIVAVAKMKVDVREPA